MNRDIIQKRDDDIDLQSKLDQHHLLHNPLELLDLLMESVVFLHVFLVFSQFHGKLLVVDVLLVVGVFGAIRSQLLFILLYHIEDAAGLHLLHLLCALNQEVGNIQNLVHKNIYFSHHLGTQIVLSLALRNKL